MIFFVTEASKDAESYPTPHLDSHHEVSVETHRLFLSSLPSILSCRRIGVEALGPAPSRCIGQPSPAVPPACASWRGRECEALGRPRGLPQGSTRSPL